MTKDEALKLALEALEVCEQSNYGRNWVWPDTARPTAMANVKEAITAIKEALSNCQCPECQVVLHASDCAVHNEPAYPKGECNCGAQPEQEPVAWEQFYPDIGKPQLTHPPQGIYYTTPQRTWVGLTRMDLIKCGVLPFGMSYELCQAIEAKLKEKNT